MKRGPMLTLSVAIALLALLSISIVLAAPERVPQLQTPEIEPNDSFAQADARGVFTVPVNLRGDLFSDTDEFDYFKIKTETGREYKSNLIVTGRSGDLQVKMSLYNGDQGFIDDHQSSLTWEAAQDTHYILIEALTGLTTTVQSAQYRISLNVIAEPPPDTPTPTATPSEPTVGDSYEDNDSSADAYPLPIQTSVSLKNLKGLANFYPAADKDWFRFWTKDGFWYEATTSELNRVDTLLAIYREDRTGEDDWVERDDDGGGGYASRVQWEAKYDGYYYIRVTNNVATTGEYNLEVKEVSAPATATPGPTATPVSPRGAADDCEDNLDFDRACVLAVDQPQTFNFVPTFGAGPDNDFYKIWVKSGLHFRCETSDLAPGVDPNMIMFNGPSWDNAIAGNDDVEEGNYNSALSYYATYDGWLYVLVGTGNRTPPDVTDSDYTLLCEKSTTPFSATRTPQPAATPDSSGKLPSPMPTATPTRAGSPVATPPPGTQGLTVRPLMTPTPAVPVTPSPRFIPIRLLVFYDSNSDLQPGAGEGIAGISAQAYEVMSNEFLAQDFTDEQGSLEFTVSAHGPVRIGIPFLGFSYLVTGTEASIEVRVPTHSLFAGAP